MSDPRRFHSDPSDPSEEDQSAGRVRGLFDGIAGRYDLANHVLSLGIDLRWRVRTAQRLAPPAGGQVLDMCCGTGDMALATARRARGPLRIVACDFSEGMLAAARAKEQRLRRAGRLGKDVRIDWLAADCTATGLETGRFDAVTCAFGVRNVQDFTAVLAEMLRVLRPGGRCGILEFSLPPRGPIRWGYLLYLRHLLPLAGGVITGRPRSYRYLANTICHWAETVSVPKQMQAAGFEHVHTDIQTLGVAGLYTGRKMGDVDPSVT